MTNCQRVDTVHDAKTLISRDLDVIRDRLGRPAPREVIDRSDPVMRRVLALEHVTRQIRLGRCTGVDPNTYVAIVDEHLTPLPEDREWLRRHSITSTARRHSSHLERQQDHRRDDALQPLEEVLERQQAAARAATVYAAWEQLHGVGLAGDGDDGDIVTRTLAGDLDADTDA